MVYKKVEGKICKGKCGNGSPCKHRATIGGYCIIHYKKLMDEFYFKEDKKKK